MAKRRRLEAPSTDALRAAEARIDGPARPGPLGPMPPIASVAGEAALAHDPSAPDARADRARADADAERYRAALAAGLIVQQVDIHAIAAEELYRDRMYVDASAMEELKASIRTHGLRLPIEVFALSEPQSDAEQAPAYGLLSGWRRLMAWRALAAETGDPRYARISAFIRTRSPETAQAYVAMVEENEIRADLSHFERGRIAVIAAEQGAFPSVEAAVNALFHSGSKAKRSKIRSFAELYQDLGDALTFPTDLSERQGLRLVAALRDGQGMALRRALARGQATGQLTDPASEWALLDAVIQQAQAQVDRDAGRPPARGPGGSLPITRARSPQRAQEGDGFYRLANGITVLRDQDSRGHLIRLEGAVVNTEMMDLVLLEIKRLLEPI